MSSDRGLRLIASHRLHLGFSGAVLLGFFLPGLARAQTVAEPADAGADTLALPAPAPPAPAAAAAAEPFTAQVGVRTLVFLQDPDAYDKLGDVGGTGEADVVFAGKVHRFMKWQAGFAGLLGGANTTDPGTTGTTAAGRAAVLDLIAKVEIAELFNLWVGRMPVPSDRSGLSTVWAIAPWTLPGRYWPFAGPPRTGPAMPIAEPRRGDPYLDRGDGATLWGQLANGRFKYYVGAFGLVHPELSPLYSGRVALDLLSPEPGFLTSSSYFGGKNVLAIGVGAQHQTQGSKPASAGPVADFNEVNADLFFEKGNEVSGVVDVEAAVAKLWGENEQFAFQTFGLLSYLVPIDIGFGRFQPLVRLQHAGAGTAGATAFTGLDAQLGYVIDGHHARLSAGWSYTRGGGQTYNAILFGLQVLTKAAAKER